MPACSPNARLDPAGTFPASIRQLHPLTAHGRTMTLSGTSGLWTVNTFSSVRRWDVRHEPSGRARVHRDVVHHCALLSHLVSVGVRPDCPRRAGSAVDRRRAEFPVRETETATGHLRPFIRYPPWGTTNLEHTDWGSQTLTGAACEVSSRVQGAAPEESSACHDNADG